MHLILNVGLAKQLHQADGQHVNATCDVSVKLDAATLTGDPEAFHRRVRDAYAACRQAMELAHQRVPSGNGAPGVPSRSQADPDPLPQAVEKKLLLDEELYLDDLHDRMACVLDDTHT
jgi:hypothetical protein